MKNQGLTAEQEFYLPVKIVDTSTILKADNSIIMPYNQKAIIVERPEGPKIVNFCSDVYGLVKNSEIFPKLEEMLNEKFIYKKHYRHSDNCVFWADYELQGKDLLIGHSKFVDEVKPCIRIMHSYNGSLRYKAVMGFKRQICSNGMWGYVYDTKFELRHSSGNLVKIFEQTLTGVDEFLSNAKTFKTVYDGMAKKVVGNYMERVELIINSTMFPKRQMSSVLDRIEKENKEHKIPVSDWLIYNAFNYQLNHNKEFTGDESYRMKIDTNVLNIINNGVQQGDKLVLA